MATPKMRRGCIDFALGLASLLGPSKWMVVQEKRRKRIIVNCALTVLGIIIMDQSMLYIHKVNSHRGSVEGKYNSLGLFAGFIK